VIFARLFHWLRCSWRRVRRMGAWDYVECRVCGKRDVQNIPGFLGPIDMRWLLTGEWSGPEHYHEPSRN
jgi:hypothetical protein